MALRSKKRHTSEDSTTAPSKKKTIRWKQFTLTQRVITFVLIFAVVGSGYLLINSLAANNPTYFSVYPTRGIYKAQDTITVTVYESSASNVNTVDAEVNYDLYQLQYQSLSCSHPFNFPVNLPATPGTAHLVCSITDSKGVNGKQPVGTIRFKVLPRSATSTTALSFNSSSTMVNPKTLHNVWTGVSSGSKFTISP